MFAITVRVVARTSPFARRRARARTEIDGASIDGDARARRARLRRGDDDDDARRRLQTGDKLDTQRTTSPNTFRSYSGLFYAMYTRAWKPWKTLATERFFLLFIASTGSATATASAVTPRGATPHVGGARA